MDLGSILPGLADRPINPTAELTPATWANQNIGLAALFSEGGIRRFTDYTDLRSYSGGGVLCG
jgi:hypothetical protein